MTPIEFQDDTTCHLRVAQLLKTYVASDTKTTFGHFESPRMLHLLCPKSKGIYVMSCGEESPQRLGHGLSKGYGYILRSINILIDPSKHPEMIDHVNRSLKVSRNLFTCEWILGCIWKPGVVCGRRRMGTGITTSHFFKRIMNPSRSIHISATVPLATFGVCALSYAITVHLGRIG